MGQLVRARRLDRAVSAVIASVPRDGCARARRAIEDYVDLTNHFYSDIGLNVHESYGYLANPFVARVIADWLDAAL